MTIALGIKGRELCYFMVPSKFLKARCMEYSSTKVTLWDLCSDGKLQANTGEIRIFLNFRKSFTECGMVTSGQRPSFYPCFA